MTVALPTEATVTRSVRFIIAPCLFLLAELLHTTAIQFTISPHLDVASVFPFVAFTVGGGPIDAPEISFLTLNAPGYCFQHILIGPVARVSLAGQAILVPIAWILVFRQVQV